MIRWHFLWHTRTTMRNSLSTQSASQYPQNTDQESLAIARSHYENFPVASIILPRRLRIPIAHIYRFARVADDIADEGDNTPEQRLKALKQLREELARIRDHKPAHTEMMQALQQQIERHDLSVSLLEDLLDAFSQDVTQQRYENFAELMQYCRKSANPIGRLLLQLNKIEDSHLIGLSDAICSALQLINFLQDIAIDYQKQRIYLPQDELKRFNISEQQIAQGDTSGAWQLMMDFQIKRATRLLQSGAPLALKLPGRMGLEMRMIVAGGERILKQLHEARGDVFQHRPKLTTKDWLIMIYRAVRKK